ncbi:hypothetical protein [Dactylosporangium darangshiense]
MRKRPADRPVGDGDFGPGHRVAIHQAQAGWIADHPEQFGARPGR